MTEEMRISRLSALVVLLLWGLLSCAKIEEQEAPESITPFDGGIVSFTASIDETKTTTYISGDQSITEWVAGDTISITSNANTFIYEATSSGPTTRFVPKYEGQGVPVAQDGNYSVTAVYGGDVFTVQNIAADGTNDVEKPLAASFIGHSDTGALPLVFVQTASLLELSFAQENLTFKELLISGLGGGDITVNFTDGLILSSGNASVQVVCGAISTDPSAGVFLRATLSDNSKIGRVIWLGSGMGKNYPVGSHVRQPLSVWKKSGTVAAGITSAKELRELQILTSKRCPVTRFTVDGTSGGKIELLADVDISWYHWAPIGPNGNQDPSEGLISGGYLRNEFDGKGHTISGLSLTRNHNSWYNYGLFGVAEADIHDLSVEGAITIKSGSSQNLNLCAGGLISTLLPGHTVQRCTTNVAIEVQYYGTEALSGSDVVTASSATAHKWQRVGGIAGRCSGNIYDCVNQGAVTFTNGTTAPGVIVNCHYGGIAGQVCDYGSSNASISGCTNSGKIQSKGYISGYSDKHSSDDSPSTVSQVFHGMSMGGIVGTLGHMVSADMTAQSGTPSMSDCANSGVIGEHYRCAGGNFGGVAGRTGCDAVVNITSCSNTGSVYGSKNLDATTQTSNNDFFYTAGGVIGACHARGGEISSLSNSGAVYDADNTAAILGGVFGIISTFCGDVTFSDLSNSGEIYTSIENATTYLNIGGIVGRLWMQKGATPVTLNAPVNTGYIHNASGGRVARVGGLIGLTPGNFILNDGVNKGSVVAWTKNGSSGYSNVCFVGGLIGEVWDLPGSFNRCKQYGYVSYNNTASYHGLVIGYLEGKGNITASSCYASGSFGVNGSTTYTIASSSDLSSMVTAPAASTSVTTGKIPIVALGGSSYYVGSPWEWGYHAPEDVSPVSGFVEEPNDSSSDPSGTFNYASLTTMGHPRILMDDDALASLKTKVTTNRAANPVLAEIHDDIISLADSYTQDSSAITRSFDASGKRILSQSRKALKRLFACSYAYRMTGLGRYLECVKRDLTAACGLSDWNGVEHFLDAAEMATGVAIAYDWCYYSLPYDIRVAAHSALVNKAITVNPSNDYVNATNNWNQVCYAGVVLGALAIYEKDKSVSRDIIESCLSHNPSAITASYTNGNFPEGYSYWAYGTNFQMLLIEALRSVFGNDGGLFSTVSWNNTATWMLMMNGPSGKAFSYSDCSPVTNEPQLAMWYLASRLSNTSLLYNELKLLDDYADCSDVRLLPMVPIMAANMSIPSSVPAPSISLWPSTTPSSSEVAPVVLVRDGWTGTVSDKFLGIKAGKPNSSHSQMDAGSFVFDAFGHRWSEDPGACDYAKAEAQGITLSSYGKSSTRWDVFLCSNFSHSTVMGANKRFDPNGTAYFTSIINSSSEKGAVINMLPVLDSDELELEGNALSSGSASRTVKMTSSGNIVVIDKIKIPNKLGGGSSTTFWWRMLTKAAVNQQSGFIELSFGDITQKYRLTVSASGCESGPTLTVWDAVGPNGQQNYDTVISGYKLVGHSFKIGYGETGTITTTLTLVN